VSGRIVTVTPVGSSMERLGVVLRDIARGGLAGLLTGILVAGVGGRIVMRLAAILVPSAVGLPTENGNRIGEITLSGTLGLVALAGLFFGLAGAVVWVVVSPWIPGSARLRALLAAPVAVALTGVSLIQASNPDFIVLRHDVATVVLLLLLVATAGVAISAFDTWLDRHLPAAGARPVADAIYLALAVAGAALISIPVVMGYLQNETALGIALVGTGVATLVRWAYRYRVATEPVWLVPFGRTALLAAVVLGTVALVPDVARAVGVAGGTR
jgi:hypothetical protein